MVDVVEVLLKEKKIIWTNLKLHLELKYSKYLKVVNSKDGRIRLGTQEKENKLSGSK